MPYHVQDQELIETKALPAAGASAGTDAMDLGARTAKAARIEPVEFELSCPAVPALVDTKTIIYAIQTDDDVAFGTPTTVYPAIVTLTGAGGAGAAAFAKRFRLATDNLERYLRATATVLADGGNNTAVSFTVKALF
jgi:hypothetical protein